MVVVAKRMEAVVAPTAEAVAVTANQQHHIQQHCGRASNSSAAMPFSVVSYLKQLLLTRPVSRPANTRNLLPSRTHLGRGHPDGWIEREA